MDELQKLLGINPALLLALGAGFAAFSAGWDRVTQFFRYVSSFIIVRHFVANERIAKAVFRKFKKEWNLIDISTSKYLKEEVFEIDRPNNWRFVLFNIPYKRAFFYKGWRIVMVDDGNTGSKLEISTIRGMMDVRKFIMDAVIEEENQTINENSKNVVDRFKIVKVYGAEKVGISNNDYRHGEKDDASEKNIPQPVGGGETVHQNTVLGTIYKEFDESFMYPRDRYTISKEVSAFKTLYYDESVLAVKERIQDWFDARDWYEERDLPWRFGAGFIGPGGTGKSAMAKAIARQLGLPVYQYFLNTLSDQEMIRKWDNMVKPCMVLFEDFDNVFHGREPQTEHKALTFDCVLNLLSGVSSVNGILLILTTNHVEHIDPALGVMSEFDSVSTRPGRIDVMVEFKTMNAENRHRMASHILRDWPEIIDDVVAECEGMTPIQFQEKCIQVAIHTIKQRGIKLSDTTKKARRDRQAWQYDNLGDEECAVTSAEEAG